MKRYDNYVIEQYINLKKKKNLRLHFQIWLTLYQFKTKYKQRKLNFLSNNKEYQKLLKKFACI